MCAPISSIRSTYDDPVTKRGVLLAGLLLALATLVPQAQAKIRTVQLTNDGPSPAGLTVRAGDVVRFVNADNVPHQVRSQGGWQYDSGPIPPGQTSAATPRLTAPGTYRYSDVRSIVILPQTFAGSITVPKPAPAPSPTSKPTPTPTPVRTSSPTPSPTPSATPSAAPPSPTARPTVRPTPVQTTPGQPVPSPTRPSPSPSLNLLYGDPQGLVQSSPHRYGLPALVAGVAIGGVLSLLGRYLLSLPEGRRTGSS
jgi:plastocyanin